ncbi:MAG TPA: hypothetical protein ENG78_07560 [Acidiferrobacteraceae bacterium]|nr:hypothetical protein [Acidiferrobacteraceae bacterium]HEX20657.1 hypothetical protein [Acidiferrobacteraceae bacterium]
MITPLAFPGGAFYSIKMLPLIWQGVTRLNPEVYLIGGFRWSFYGVADVSAGISVDRMFFFMQICLAAIWWISRTGHWLNG